MSNTTYPQLTRCHQFRGFGHKTACLLMSALYGRPYGIAVDRHVKKTAINLGLVCGFCPHDKSNNKVGSDLLFEISVQLMEWVPSDKWTSLNDNIGVLKQFLQNRQMRKQLYEIATSMSPCHTSILSIIDK